ncbi:Potassium transporter [Rhynchospora pubera]|uniref:Potassium transporter n=1 Tax=Rhynchospora pubera TaxID=906938 RepID=A0AAV8D5L5_9POAL|nr:Potassium transporter [Rhynchospora pubera]
MSTEVQSIESVPVSREQSRARLPRINSFFHGADRVTHAHVNGVNDDWVRTLRLAFQSIGVVYGDIGTSPLYVYASTFTDGIKHQDDILGVLSLIIYSLILLPMLKYVFIVLWANDNGDDQVDWISVAIFVALFAAQRFGTDKVGYSFAPIVSLYFLFIGGIGLYNLVHYDIGVLRAFNPKYIVDYFSRNRKQGWISLGGILLCYTGTEAMFADLGHFNVRAIQIGFSFALFPAVSLAYIGQAAYLRKHPEDVAGTYYKSIPSPLYWPVFVVSVAAAIIASQAMISGAFAIVSQSQALGCFPQVKVLHTSKKYEGQVYIPEVNFALAVACIVLTFLYKDTTKIGNAYGIAVTAVMFITTIFLTLVMLLIWRTSILWIILFFAVFGSTEIIFLSSALYKFKQGGYFPIAVAGVLMLIMGIWNYVYVKKYWYELTHMVTKDKLEELTKNYTIGRIPGIGFLYSELAQGIPPIFAHLVEKVPYIHSVFVFVSVKNLPIPYVSSEERFIFRQAGPIEQRLFRCIVRYGYNDEKEDANVFAASMIEQLKNYVHDETLFAETTEQQLNNENIRQRPVGQSTVHAEERLEQVPESQTEQSEPQHIHESILIYEQELANGVVYLLGETEVRAEPSSNIFKKLLVNCFYNFLKKNFRQGEKVLQIPRDQILKVGMVYEI